MNGNRTVKAMSMLLLLQGFGTASAVDNSAWEGIASIFARIVDVNASVADSSKKYQNYSKELEKLGSVYDKAADSSHVLLECVSAKFDGLRSDVDKCLSNKAEISNQTAAEIADLQNQIANLIASTSSTINDLRGKINALQHQIDQMQLAMATLTELNLDNANKIVAQLSNLKAQYGAMLAVKEAFLAQLVAWNDKVKAYAFEAAGDVAKLGSSYCAN